MNIAENTNSVSISLGKEYKYSNWAGLNLAGTKNLEPNSDWA